MSGPYKLYLIRHGIAEERGGPWADDTKRPLTDEGIKAMRKTARGLARLGVGFDVILTSPLVRAKQTADAVASAYRDEPPQIVVIDSLAPGGSTTAVIHDLEKQTKHTRIALVGHEPNLGELAARLAGLRLPLEFKKGAICRIDVKTFPVGPGKMRWFASSKMLSMLRK